MCQCSCSCCGGDTSCNYCRDEDGDCECCACDSCCNGSCRQYKDCCVGVFFVVVLCAVYVCIWDMHMSRPIWTFSKYAGT